MKWKKFFALIAIFAFAALFNRKVFLAKSANINLPTQVKTTPAVVTLTQDYYRWYGNLDSLTPSSTLASENTATSTPAAGTVLRLRMNVLDGSVDLPAGKEFKLQYANSTSGSWTDLSSSTAWTFFDNPSVADGQIIVTTVLSNSNTGESYAESNPSAASPNSVLQGQRGEWDWVIENNSADTASGWFFRMVYSSSTALDFYQRYAELTAVSAPAPAPAPTPSGGGGGATGVGGGQITPPPLATTTQTSARPPGLPIPPPLLPPAAQIVDLDGDNRVDIVDLSILLYYYGRSDQYALRYDFDRNGVVDLPDISIMMFYWTS